MNNMTPNYPAIIDINSNAPVLQQQQMRYLFPLMNPSSKEEFYRSIRAVGAIFNNQTKSIEFLKELFQNGTLSPDKKCFTDGRTFVFFDSYQDGVFGSVHFGMWFDINTGYYGLDFWSLCSYVNCKDMSNTMHMLVAYADKHGLYTDNNDKRMKWYEQVKVPVGNTNYNYNYNFNFSSGKCVHNAYYYTNYGKIFKVVKFWNLPNIGIIPVYFTLWKHGNSQKYQIQPLFPERPYCLYNLHLLPKNNEDCYFKNIVFVSDEREADRLTDLTFTQNSNVPFFDLDLNKTPAIDFQFDFSHIQDIDCDFDELLSGKVSWLNINLFVFTTCFKGFAGIKDADLSPLEGKKVYLYLPENSQDEQHLPEAITSLKKARCLEIWVRIGDLKFINADEYLREISKNNEDHLFLPEANLKRPYKICTPEEKIEGEDIVPKTLLSPIIMEGNTIWIYGKEGTYKSFMGMMIAQALSSGNKTLIKWHTNEPVKVLYIDGETPPNLFKQRMDQIVKGMNCDHGKRAFSVISVLDFSGENTNMHISNTEWQQRIEDTVRKVDVIIIDNFYSLTENTIKAATNAIQWFKELKQDKKTIIVLDHTNSDGVLQGSIEKRRFADLIMKIEADEACEDANDRLNIIMEKTRYIEKTEYKKPFKIDIVSEEDAFRMEVVDAPEKEVYPLSDMDKKIALCKILSNKGLTGVEIQRLTSINDSSVSLYKKKDMPSMTDGQREELEKEAKGLYAKYLDLQKPEKIDAESPEK